MYNYSFFQEAHKMVQEANVKRAQAEKSFAESEMKVDRRQSNILKWIHQCNACFDLDVRKDDTVAMLHHQFYSAKLLAIATCKTDTAT